MNSHRYTVYLNIGNVLYIEFPTYTSIIIMIHEPNLKFTAEAWKRSSPIERVNTCLCVHFGFSTATEEEINCIINHWWGTADTRFCAWKCVLDSKFLPPFYPKMLKSKFCGRFPWRDSRNTKTNTSIFFLDIINSEHSVSLLLLLVMSMDWPPFCCIKAYLKSRLLPSIVLWFLLLFDLYKLITDYRTTLTNQSSLRSKRLKIMRWQRNLRGFRQIIRTMLKP